MPCEINLCPEFSGQYQYSILYINTNKMQYLASFENSEPLLVELNKKNTNTMSLNALEVFFFSLSPPPHSMRNTGHQHDFRAFLTEAEPTCSFSHLPQ